MTTITLPNGWTPRPYQMEAWNQWEAGCLRQLLIWHRRAGKDDVALHMAAVAAHRRIANYWHCLPSYEQARKAIWESINPHSGRFRIDEAFPQELRDSTNSQTMTIRFKSGSTWRVVGSDNPDSLVGAAPAGIVFSEWALSNPSAWAYLAPILEENGGWASFITTPRGRNHVWTLLNAVKNDPKWFVQVLPITATGALSSQQVDNQRKEYHGIYGVDAGDALIDQEYLCSFEAAILGAYWGRELRDLEAKHRLTAVDADSSMEVHTAWDLGIGDAMALWFFQVVGPEIRVIDWYEATGHGLDHYAAVKRKKGYRYGHDFVPHDAKVRELGASGRTRIESMLELGLKPRLIENAGLEDGINAARITLPRCWFDLGRCAEGIERLRQYRSEWDDERKVFSNKPRHDWTSHSADAFRYLALAWRELSSGPRKPKPRERRLGIGPSNEVTFNDLIKSNGVRM